MSSMKAIVQHRYGSADVLAVQDVERPVVGDEQVLVRVHAASVNPVDWHTMTGTPYVTRLDAGPRRPKRIIRGVDVAGRVEAVGVNVSEFQPGDVFGVSGGSRACTSSWGVEEGPDAAVIDRTYELADTAEALRYLEQGHAHGKIVITMGGQGGVIPQDIPD